MNRNLFDFNPSAWLPTQDKAVLEYCRNIKRVSRVFLRREEVGINFSNFVNFFILGRITNIFIHFQCIMKISKCVNSHKERDKKVSDYNAVKHFVTRSV